MIYLNLIEKLGNDMNFLQSSMNLDTQESSIIEKYELSKIDYSNNESNVNALEKRKGKTS
jgi:hypothetical protein